MRCRWDPATGDYRYPDGEPCERDEWGDPSRHCTARRSCGIHIAPDELTCPRCVHRVRATIRRVVELAALMLSAALDTGRVDTEPAELAGPAADPRAIRDFRFYVDGHATRQLHLGHIDGATYERILAALPDDDERHPYGVLTRWQMMLAEDYGHELPARLTIAGAGAYLDRQLARIAQDPEQEFPLLARETGKVRSHLESVLRNDHRPERGAPCPEDHADQKVHRLVREYPHWCEEEDCPRQHYADSSHDRWRCPADPEHWWTHKAYEDYLAERHAGAQS